MEAIVLMLGKVLGSIGLRLLTGEVIEKLIVWTLEKVAESTKTDFDNELLVIIKEGLDKKKA